MKGYSAKYQAGAKAGPRTQCGTNAANALRAPPREITLGIGDVVNQHADVYRPAIVCTANDGAAADPAVPRRP
jgi:hypothetical protein